MAGTTITPTALFGPSAVSSSNVAVFTTPPDTLVTINRVVVTNITTAAVGLMVRLVRSGGSVTSNSNILIGSISGGQSMAAGPSEPYIANSMASLVLNAGDSIVASATTSGALNIVGSGWSQ